MYKTFVEMPVWQKAMDLAVNIFEMTERLPKKEDFGLTSQVRRSALSVSANIAESFGREHTLDKLNFYYHARGSLSETRSHLIYGHCVKYFSDNECNKVGGLLADIWKDINTIIKSFRSKVTKPQPWP